MGSNGEIPFPIDKESGESRELFQLRRRIQSCCWFCWLLATLVWKVITTLTLEITAVCDYIFIFIRQMTANRKRKNNKTRNVTCKYLSAVHTIAKRKPNKHNNHRLPSNTLYITLFHQLNGSIKICKKVAYINKYNTTTKKERKRRKNKNLG